MRPADGEPRWVVVRTKSHQEKITVQHLALRRLKPYCPLIVEPPWHPRAPRGPVPLFASYIFVYCCPLWHLSAIRFCPGSLGPVTFDGQLATVSEELIAALREREGTRGHILPVEMEMGIGAGNKVRLMAGPLRGLEGVFHSYLRGGQRARVLMEFLRSRKLVEVDSEVLALAR